MFCLSFAGLVHEEVSMGIHFISGLSNLDHDNLKKKSQWSTSYIQNWALDHWEDTYKKVELVQHNITAKIK